MSNLYYESSLSHYGVRGQKWGVRRYQTSDGRWTHLGRHRNQVKDLKRSERDKTDRTKARLEAQKKKLAYEKSLGPSDHPTRDAIKAKAKEKVADTTYKAKVEKAKYDKAILESKRADNKVIDLETSKFLKSVSLVALANVKVNKSRYDATELKSVWKEKVTDIGSDIVDRIDNLKFR